MRPAFALSAFAALVSLVAVQPAAVFADHIVPPPPAVSVTDVDDVRQLPLTTTSVRVESSSPVVFTELTRLSGLIAIDLADIPGADNDHLALLSEFPGLQYLTLRGETMLSEAGVGHIAELPGLHSLVIHKGGSRYFCDDC